MIYEGYVSKPHGKGDMYNNGVEAYTITIKKPTKLRIELTSDQNQAVFTLLEANNIVIGFDAKARKWSGTITKTGTFRITVLTTNETAKFKLKVTKL